MSKFDVLVQANHVIFDDEGHMLVPNGVFSVKDGPLVQNHISDGLLTVVTSKPEPAVASEEAPKDDQKKAANIKPRTQATETDN